MRRYLLYVASPQQVANAKSSMELIKATPSLDRSMTDSFIITHKSLGGLELRLNLIDNIDAVVAHLRQYPVDMMIYDEREGGVDAVKAIEQIRADVEALADLWGPDFHFPMGRMIAILQNGEQAAHKTFTLGRDHIRDVLVDPRNLAKVLRWIAKILVSDFQSNKFKVGMALNGGGLEGFLFQIGCLYALEKALSERSIYDCELYSGVSSGSIGASILASHIPIKEVIASLHGRSEKLPPLGANTLYDLAVAEIASRVFRQSIFWAGMDPMKWIQKLIRAMPTGFFKGDKLKAYALDAISRFGGDDSFHSLDCELYIGATNQDTFEHVVLGKPPWDDIRISEAVRASCALPPFFTPIQIKDQRFIDGQITRSCNLELTVRKGCNLIFIIDPMKPYTTFEQGYVEEEGGIFTLIQTIKTLVYSRFRAALSHLTERYPDVDFLVFQPYEECAQIMAGSPMKIKMNTRIIDLAYKGTLRRLRERHHVYATKLAKFGFHLASQRLLLEMERTGIDI